MLLFIYNNIMHFTDDVTNPFTGLLMRADVLIPAKEAGIAVVEIMALLCLFPAGSYFAVDFIIAHNTGGTGIYVKRIIVIHRIIFNLLIGFVSHKSVFYGNVVYAGVAAKRAGRRNVPKTMGFRFLYAVNRNFAQNFATISAGCDFENIIFAAVLHIIFALPSIAPYFLLCYRCILVRAFFHMLACSAIPTLQVMVFQYDIFFVRYFT